jgi:hypothetical protein
VSSFSEGLAVVNQLLGTPYVWGGNGTGGVDCSGFTRAVYEAMGIDLPRVSYQQANAGQHITQAEARPGDLVWWDLNGRNPGADHVGIYMGNGKVAEASSSKGQVVIRNLWGDAQFTTFQGIDDRGATTVAAPTEAHEPGSQQQMPVGTTNPIGTQDSTGAFGTLGANLSEADTKLLHELYAKADESDPGERPDTVGPYHVARLTEDRANGGITEAGEGKVQSPILDRPAAVRPTAGAGRFG